MLTARVHVVEWAARATQREARADWYRWAGRSDTQAPARPQHGAMPMMLRRRLTPIGQSAIAAAYEAGAGGAVHYVFCSRHGEFTRSLRIMRTLAEGQDPSPADFSVSVHNALAGLLSIATSAKAGHSAIAAGPDSFAAGLIEAVALLTADPAQRVLLVYFDEALPAPYHEIEPTGEAPLVLAALLSLAPDVGEPIQMSVTAPASFGRREGTLSQAIAFTRFLASGEARRFAPGERMNLEWSRIA